MRFESICARLVRPPMRLSMEQIKRLTLHQLLHVYHHPEDEHGNIDPHYVATGKGDGATTDGPPSDEEKIKAKWRKRGYSEALIALKWGEFIEEQGYLAGLENARPPIAPDEIARRMETFREEQLRRRKPF